MPYVYMNARRVEQEKVQLPGDDGKAKLFPVIYEAGYIYDLPEATANAWCRLFVALPIKDNKVKLRNGKTVTLSSEKRAQLTREPGRPNHPVVVPKSRPSLEDATEPAPKAKAKKTAKKKKTRKKKTTRKSAKKAGKRSKKK